MKELNEREALRAFRNRFPTQNDAAAALQISRPYFSDLLNGRRDLSDHILAKLGLKRIVVKEAKEAR